MMPVIVQKAPYDRQNGTSHSMRIDHQNHRRLRHLCQMVGRSLLTDSTEAVVKSHHALHYRKVCALCRARKKAFRQSLPSEKSIQIPGRDAEHRPMEHRIDIVRPALDGTDAFSFL